MRSITAERLIANLAETGSYASDYEYEPGLGSAKQIISDLRASRTIDEEVLTRAVAKTLHMRYLPPSEVVVSELCRSYISRYQPESIRMLPLYSEVGVLYVAVDDPFDIDLHERAEALFESQIELLLVSASALTEAIKHSHSAHDRLTQVSRALPDTKERGDYQDESSTIDENSAPIVKLFNTILREAVSRQASDIHIEAQSDGTLVRCRVDGVLRPMMEPLGHAYHDALLTRIKVMSELDIAERRIAQDGRFTVTLETGSVDFRVSILPGAEHEAVVIRILDRQGIPGKRDDLTLENIGLPGPVLQDFRKSILAPHGMVLVTGPTGSGKTSTLYAALNELDRSKEKIITIEDPIEYRLDDVLQIPVNEKKKVTFASGLRSILRHDPDKIMVGEVRDAETAGIAVQSALTGHLVFTTVHANDSMDVIFRMKHMGIDPDSFIHALNCILSQRLIRKLCTSCKRKAEVTNELLKPYACKHEGTQWYTADGCENCDDTGYAGRVVIAEILRVTPKVRDLLKTHNEDSIMKWPIDEGSTLHQSAMALAISGITSLDEVVRVTGVD